MGLGMAPQAGTTPQETKAPGFQGNKKNAPAPADHMGAANAQSAQNAQLNRPDVSTPFAAEQWTKDANGNWQLNTNLSGGLGSAAGSLEGQAANSLGQPLDFSGLPQIDSGQQARDQAINAAYGQATSRLDPQWDLRQKQLDQKLANQGLSPDSEAGRNAIQELGRERNDAYGSAMNSAIGQGTAAGNQIFQNSVLKNQLAQAQALRQREQPLMDLSQIQGFLQMPGFNQVEGPNLLAASMAQGNDAFRNWQANQQAQGDAMGGLGSLLGTVGGTLLGGPLGGALGGGLSKLLFGGGVNPSDVPDISEPVPFSL